MLRLSAYLSFLATFSCLTSCASNSTDNCDLSSVTAGQLLGSIDDANWSTSDVSYVWSGSSLMVNAPSAVGYWMSAVLQKDDSGVSIDESLTAEESLQVTLDSTGTTGWITIYPESGSSYTTKSGGGSFSVTLNADDTLSGCFTVDAASGDESLNATGQFIALPSTLGQ
jgi:hypothetical protein